VIAAHPFDEAAEIQAIQAMNRAEAGKELTKCWGGLAALNELDHEAGLPIRVRLTTRVQRLHARLRRDDPTEAIADLARDLDLPEGVELAAVFPARWGQPAAVHVEGPNAAGWVSSLGGGQPDSRVSVISAPYRGAVVSTYSPAPGGAKVAGAPRLGEATAAEEGDASPAPSPVLAGGVS